MEEIKFNSLNDLYNRIYPAFNTEKIELKKKGINIREIDLWNFLKESTWHDKENLSIYDMVKDIFDIDETKLINYINKTK